MVVFPPLPFFLLAGVSLAGASSALCGGVPDGGGGKGTSSPSKAASAGSLAGGADTKPAQSYADRLVRLMHLVDPRHALTTGEDIQRYRALLEESKAAAKVRPLVPHPILGTF